MNVNNSHGDRFFLDDDVVIRQRFDGKLYHSSVVLTGKPTPMERTMPVNGVQEITANEAVKFLMAEYGKSADEAERLVVGLGS